MSSAKTLLLAARSIANAIPGAEHRWETGDDDGWPPRRMAEHCVDRDFELSAMAAVSVRATPPPTAHRALPT